MQTLSISEYGFQYMQKCLEYYTENCACFLFYVMALIYIAVKGSRREKQIFLPGALLLLLSVFNPVFPVVINSLFDVNKEYYRLFWIPPVVLLTAWFAAKIIGTVRGVKKWFTAAALLAIVCISGSFVYKDGYIRAQNIYKMPTEIPEISQMIHEDSDVEYPRVMFEYDYQMLIRQYDAKILLPVDREGYINAVTGNLTMEEINAEENFYNRLLAVVALNIKIDKEEFLRGLDETNTEYVVVSTANNMNEYLVDAGLTLTGQTANHSVYHYDLKDPVLFELPDYSDVWENY